MMFTLFFLVFLGAATDPVTGIKSASPMTQEDCLATLAHDLPIVEEIAKEKFGDDARVEGSCKPAEGKPA